MHNQEIKHIENMQIAISNGFHISQSDINLMEAITKKISKLNDRVILSVKR